MIPLLKEAIVLLGQTIIKSITKIINKPEGITTSDSSHPLPYKAIEHQRAQEQASIAASKLANNRPIQPKS